MTLLCNNCDMHFDGRKPVGWHGVKRVRSAKQAKEPLTGLEAIYHGEFGKWWTHEGWCPECVAEGKCNCAECVKPHRASTQQRELFAD